MLTEEDMDGSCFAPPELLSWSAEGVGIPVEEGRAYLLQALTSPAQTTFPPGLHPLLRFSGL